MDGIFLTMPIISKTINKYYVLFLIINGVIFSQSENNFSKQIWIDLNPSYYFNPGLQLFGDIGVRKEVENNGWMRFVIRPSLRTWLGSKFNFYTGVGSFYTFNKLITNRWEIRPFQGISTRWPDWEIPIHHYFRIEERFDFNTETWKAQSSIRVRYRLSASYKWDAVQYDRFWQATFSIEPFFTLVGNQGQFQEQVRVTAGLNRSFAYDSRIRFEITWQQEQLFFKPEDLVSNIYLRFRWFQNWGKI